MNIQIGLSGAEVTIPKESRAVSSNGGETISFSGRAADGTLHEDFINRKRSWTIDYNVITEANRTLLENIHQLQITNGSFLSLLIDDSTGVPQSYTVRMSFPTFGPLLPRGGFYYRSGSFTLEEV